MADPGVIGSLPMPQAAGSTGALRGAPTSNAGGLAAARVFSSPDFATDLARLVALLGTGLSNAAEPIAAADANAAAPVEPVETGGCVDALCAEVALAIPVMASPATPEPLPADPPIPTDSEDPAVAADGRAPARTLQVLLTPPGLAGAAEHRSDRAGEGPTMPTLPLLPAAAGGAAAFTVTTPTGSSPDPAGSGDIAVPTPSDAASHAPVGTIPSLESLARPAAAPHTVAATIVDVLQPQAPRQIAETVAWHVPAQGAAEVRIRLNPEELGRVDVQLKLDGDKVSVLFDLADERVRDVVQSSLPSLSAMLSARGLQLDQAQVFAQARGQGSPQQHPHPHPQAPGLSGKNSDGDTELSMSAVMRPMIRRGLLDDYA